MTMAYIHRIVGFFIVLIVALLSLMMMMIMMIGYDHLESNFDLSLSSLSLWMRPTKYTNRGTNNLRIVRSDDSSSSSSISLSYLRGITYNSMKIIPVQTETSSSNRNFEYYNKTSNDLNTRTTSNRSITSIKHQDQQTIKMKNVSTTNRRLFDVYQFEQREDMFIDSNNEKQRHRDELTLNYSNNNDDWLPISLERKEKVVVKKNVMLKKIAIAYHVARGFQCHSFKVETSSELHHA